MHPTPEGANSLLYTLLVFTHILTGMVAIGFNFTYAIWIQLATRHPEMLPFALKGIKFLDDYIANPLYIAAGITGTIMILMGKPVASFLALAIIIYLIVMAAAYLIYTPMLSKQIKLLAEKGAASAEYKAYATLSNGVGAAMGIAALVIVGLKIFEPTFW